MSIIYPVFKKGDRSELKNYRGISLLNVAYKIFASIISEKLKSYVINIVGPYQCGFMPGKSTTDQLFTLRQILEKPQEKQIPTYHLFIDFRQAYDTPNRDELYRAINHFGIPSKLINLSQMTLQDTWSCVKAAGGVSEKFQTLRGFRQLLQHLTGNTMNMITNKSTQILGYADDIDLSRKRS